MDENKSENWIPALLVALLLGVGLHELFHLWPSILTEFTAPVNESIWEHVKVIFWPLLLVELGCFPPEHRAAGLHAILISCALMLVSGGLYHLVFRGSALWVDLLIFGCCIFGYFLLSELKWGKRAPLPLLWLLTAGMILLLFLFTLSPPHGALFSELGVSAAWEELLC